jgi:hypothetical protein
MGGIGIMKKILTEANKKLLPICLVCGKKLNPSMSRECEDWNNGWLGGTVDRISIPYGSRYDLMALQVSLCDDCLEKGMKSKRILVLSIDESKEAVK